MKSYCCACETCFDLIDNEYKTNIIGTDWNSEKLNIILNSCHISRIIFCDHRTTTTSFRTTRDFYLYRREEFIPSYSSLSNINKNDIHYFIFTNFTYFDDHKIFRICASNNVPFNIYMPDFDENNNKRWMRVEITDFNNMIENGSIIEFISCAILRFKEVEKLATSFELEELFPQQYICKSRTLTKRAVAK